MMIRSQYFIEQKIWTVSNYLTVAAVFIACIGLFGLASFLTQQRTKEIGIRKVMGASAAGLAAKLAREFLAWVALAVVLACPARLLGVTEDPGHVCLPGARRGRALRAGGPGDDRHRRADRRLADPARGPGESGRFVALRIKWGHDTHFPIFRSGTRLSELMAARYSIRKTGNGYHVPHSDSPVRKRTHFGMLLNDISLEADSRPGTAMAR